MKTQGYSTDVTLQLVVDGVAFQLSQIWPGYIALREPVELPVCDGEVVMRVDGRERRWPVRLVDGAQPFAEEARVIRCVEK